MDIHSIVERQKAFFDKGHTLDINYRINALKNLYKAIELHAEALQKALKLDLGKSAFEADMCEIRLTLSEITYQLKHIKKFSKEKRVKTPLSNFASRSYVKPSPYGNVLIMSPWNYPVLLTLEPLCNALAAGNTAVIKPSNYAPKVSHVLNTLLSETFDPEYVAVIEGGRNENKSLLEEKFDYIFFTGSLNVGKYVMRCASEHLTPVTLELGGKSPVVIDRSANLPLAAKRIVFGKYLNCGQTCVAPDYVLIDKAIKDKFVNLVKAEISKQFGDNPLENPNYGKIINNKHFERILSLINQEKTVHGGNYNKEDLRIEPTVLDNVSLTDPVMQEEIFGPILPILTYNSIDEAKRIIKDRPHPLAFYVFSNDKRTIKSLTSEIGFGGGCVNDVVVHLATSEMGFGGFGESGMGSYHGKEGFRTFSHYKSIMDKKTWIDLPMRYQKYTEFNHKLLKFFLK